ncbi:MAG: N-acetyltransferase family protein [Bacillota bacterium]
MNIMTARISDLDAVAQIDSEVIGNTSRRDFLEKAIRNDSLIIVEENDEVVGFLVCERNFFDCAFISLIVVSNTKRRMGYGSEMLNYMVNNSPTTKIFSSTNRSNHSMQKVFEANGFIKSGIVENLDEGDPEIIYFRWQNEY